MASSLCEAADCLGLATSTDGVQCITIPVECHDGVLAIRSPGTVVRRYAVGGTANPAGGSIDLTPNVQVLNSGPEDAAGADKLTVTLRNPLCDDAFVTINFEFSAAIRMAMSDAFSVFGEVSLAGANFVEDNTPPFDTANLPAAGPGSYSQIAAYVQEPVGVGDQGEIYDFTHTGSFTVMTRLTPLQAVTFVGHCLVRATPRGPLRQLVSYNAAVTFGISKAL